MTNTRQSPSGLWHASRLSERVRALMDAMINDLFTTPLCVASGLRFFGAFGYLMNVGRNRHLSNDDRSTSISERSTPSPV